MVTRYAVTGPTVHFIKIVKTLFPAVEDYTITDVMIAVKRSFQPHNGAHVYFRTSRGCYSCEISRIDMDKDYKISNIEDWSFHHFNDNPKTWGKHINEIMSDKNYYKKFILHEPVFKKNNDFYA